MKKYLVIYPKNKDAEKMLINIIAGKTLEQAKKRLCRFKIDFQFYIIMKPVKLILESENKTLLTATRNLVNAKIPNNILEFKEFNNRDEAFNYGG